MAVQRSSPAASVLEEFNSIVGWESGLLKDHGAGDELFMSSEICDTKEVSLDAFGKHFGAASVFRSFGKGNCADFGACFTDSGTLIFFCLVMELRNGQN